MQIEMITKTKHDRFTFEQGRTYVVPDAIGAYFITHGWAKKPGEDAPAAALPALKKEHVVEVKNGTHKAGTRNK